MTPPMAFDYPASGLAIAAILVGAAGFLPALLAKEQKVSQLRQAWIDSLREDLAEFIVTMQVVLELTRVRQAAQGEQKAMEHFLSAQAELRKALALYYRIRLRLNPRDHKELLDGLTEVANLFSGKREWGEAFAESNIGRIFEGVLDASQGVLKGEWRRVKRGEPLFAVVKYGACALLVAGLAAAALYASKHLEVSWREPSPAAAQSPVPAGTAAGVTPKPVNP